MVAAITPRAHQFALSKSQIKSNKQKIFKIKNVQKKYSKTPNSDWDCFGYRDDDDDDDDLLVLF